MTTAVSAGTVGSAMLLEPTVHPAGLTVAEARDAFDFSRKRHMLLLVADGGMLRGTLTRDDLASDTAGPDSPALDLASVEGRTVSPDAPLELTHEAMRERGIRRLAVTDGHGRLLGLLCLKRSLRGFCTDEGVAALRAERASQGRIEDDRLDVWQMWWRGTTNAVSLFGKAAFHRNFGTAVAGVTPDDPAGRAEREAPGR